MHQSGKRNRGQHGQQGYGNIDTRDVQRNQNRGQQSYQDPREDQNRGWNNDNDRYGRDEELRRFGNEEGRYQDFGLRDDQEDPRFDRERFDQEDDYRRAGSQFGSEQRRSFAERGYDPRDFGGTESGPGHDAWTRGGTQYDQGRYSTESQYGHGNYRPRFADRRYDQGVSWGQDNSWGNQGNSWGGQGGNGSRSGSYGSQSNYGNQGTWSAQGSYGSTEQNRNHSGRGPKGYKRSDDRIREDINDRLTHDSQIDASDIEVKVSEGNITLEGTVDDRRIKRRAEDIAESVSGAQDVINHLRVKRDNQSSTESSQSSTTQTENGQRSRGTHARS